MQVHSPNHTSAGICYLCGKPHWRTDPDEKKITCSKTSPHCSMQRKKNLDEKKKKTKRGEGEESRRRKKQKDIEKASFARPVSQYHSSLGSCTNG